MSESDYLFVSIPVLRRRDGIDLAEDYRVVIRDHAARGWNLVQILPLDHHSQPRYDLVFTRKGGTTS